ncbi:MAG TPA: hypothetical protein VF618_20435 [Thermoanaerobaculia bacterium]
MSGQVLRDGLRDRDPQLDASREIETDLQRATWRSGRFYLLSQIRLADIGYDEVFFVPTSDHGGGLTVTVDAPQKLYYAPTKKVIFSATVAPGYSFFEKADRSGQFNIHGRADAHFLFNHLYLDVFGSVADVLASQTTEINRLTTIKQSEVGVAGELKYSSRTSMLFRTSYEQLEHPLDRFQPEDVPVELLDRDARNVRVSLRHKTFPLTSTFIFGERSNYGFRYATYKDGHRDYAGAGADWNNGRSRLRVEAGAAQLVFEDPQYEPFQGILGSVDWNRTTRRWNFNGLLRRDLQFSILENQNYLVVHRGGLLGEFSATPRLRLRVGTSLERTNYDRPDVNGQKRQDDISFNYGGFRWTRRHFMAGLDVGWYERTSTTFGDDESGIRTIVHLSFTP